MSETQVPSATPSLSAAESERLQTALKDIAERSQKVLQDFAERYKAEGPQPVDPLNLTRTFLDFTARMMADPNKLMQAQIELWQQYMQLWQLTAQRMMGALLRGVSTRQYEEVLPEMASTAGVSKSSISRQAIEGSAEQLRQLRERRWDKAELLVIYIDGQRFGAHHVISTARAKNAPAQT